MRLNDKIVLVTASTRGIGLACVKACAKEGAIVYMAARNLERAQEIADNLNAEGGISGNGACYAALQCIS